MEILTDHDLLQVVNKWAKDLPNEELIGIRTAFAAGFMYAEKLYLTAVSVTDRKVFECDNLKKQAEINHGLKLCTKCKGFHSQTKR